MVEMYPSISILPLLLLHQIEGQLAVPRTVVEGRSTNIEIPCNLNRELHPLYWNITGRVYELFSVPAIFTATSPDALTLASVNRRMNGWTLQCFTIDPANENGLITGVTTVLIVLYGISVCLSVCQYVRMYNVHVHVFMQKLTQEVKMVQLLTYCNHLCRED